MSTKKLPCGFTAEFETTGPESNNCYLIKGDQGGSLEAVQVNGVLDAFADNPIVVPDSVIEQALKWAESKGY